MNIFNKFELNDFNLKTKLISEFNLNPISKPEAAEISK